ncbi:hypothetical protein Pfo_007664, partial [Paulownia fortunei]
LQLRKYNFKCFQMMKILSLNVFRIDTRRQFFAFSYTHFLEIVRGEEQADELGTTRFGPSIICGSCHSKCMKMTKVLDDSGSIEEDRYKIHRNSPASSGSQNPTPNYQKWSFQKFGDTVPNHRLVMQLLL